MIYIKSLIKNVKNDIVKKNSRRKIVVITGILKLFP